MTEQIAVNFRALSNLAARLERLGYTGDSHAEAEAIALNLLADGFRHIDPPPPLRGTGSSRQAIDAALAACAEAVAHARHKRSERSEG